MGKGVFPSISEDDRYYDRSHPAVDSDGYVEDWWKRAVDDSEMLYNDD